MKAKALLVGGPCHGQWLDQPGSHQGLLVVIHEGERVIYQLARPGWPAAVYTIPGWDGPDDFLDEAYELAEDFAGDSDLADATPPLEPDPAAQMIDLAAFMGPKLPADIEEAAKAFGGLRRAMRGMAGVLDPDVLRGLSM